MLSAGFGRAVGTVGASLEPAQPHMSTSAATILAHLMTVERERAHRAVTPGLGAKVVALKVYQQRRFSHTYADLLQSPRYGPASRFFDRWLR